jgi:hypothetical protein
MSSSAEIAIQAAEADEGETREGVHKIAEPSGGERAGAPHNDRDRQGGEDVAGPSHQGGADRLDDGPAALAGDQGDRNPVIGHDGMQHANGCDSADEEKLRGREDHAQSWLEVFGR